MRFSALLFICALGLSILTACGGGGGNGVVEGEDLVPPEIQFLDVTEIFPQPDAEDVEPDVRVHVTFEKLLDPGTVDADSIVLEMNGAPIDGQVLYTAPLRRLSFTPIGDLPLGAVIRATLAPGLRDQDGNEAEDALVFEFETRAAVFQAPQLRELLPARMRLEGVALSPDGKGGYLRSEEGASTTTLRFHHYDAAQGFGGIVTVHEHPSILATDSFLVSNRVGDMAAVWFVSDGTQRDAYMRRYSRASGTWGGVDTLEDDPDQDLGRMRAALSDAGDVVAVWLEENVDTGDERLAGRSFVAGQGWSDVEDVGAGQGDVYHRHFHVGFNTARQAYFVSAQDDLGGALHTFVRRWDTATRFAAPTNVTVSLDANLPRGAVIDADGQITVLCRDFDGRLDSVRYVPGVGWEAPRPIEDRLGAADGAEGAELVIDEAGTVTFGWLFDGESVNVRRLTRAGILSPVAPLYTTVDGLGFRVELVVTGANRMMVFWQSRLTGSGRRTWGTEFDGAVWGPSRRVAPDVESGDDLLTAPDGVGGAFLLASVEDNDPLEGYYRIAAYHVPRGLVPNFAPVMAHDVNANLGYLDFVVDGYGRGFYGFVASTPGVNDEDLWAGEFR